MNILIYIFVLINCLTFFECHNINNYLTLSYKHNIINNNKSDKTINQYHILALPVLISLKL